MDLRRKFKLSDQFLEQYKEKKPDWGPVGEFVYLRTYSRKKPDGAGNEVWWETVRRVVEGIYNFQKNHCQGLRLPWNDRKAQRSAKIMYEKIFNMKFLPSGRALWTLGTEFVEKYGSASLFNCAACTTEDIATRLSFPFTWTMSALMLGVGVGFDTKGAGKMMIKKPGSYREKTFVVPDSRQGWVEALKLCLDAYFTGSDLYKYDYSLVRPYGAPIKGFGGVASGPEPLNDMLDKISSLLDSKIGSLIKSTDIVDIMNMIGCCVVAGNVRRCIPENSLVYTKNGLKKIRDVNVGDSVLTSNGYENVKNKFYQGIQKTVKIVTQDGEFVCTPNHKMAVLTDINEYEWKQAGELKNGDRLISTRQSIEGIETYLPEWFYEKPKHSTTCQDISIPELDEDIAWLIGLFHADGYTYANRKNNGFNAYVSIVFGESEYEMAKKAKKQLEKFGVKNVVLKHRKNENSWSVSCQSKQLAWYMDEHVKKPNKTIRVPKWILNAKESIKLAYVSGVLDGDGCSHTKPVNVVTTVYREFAKDIQNLLYSCGMESRFNECSDKYKSRQGWKRLYQINLIGLNPKVKLSQVEQLNKEIRIGSKASKSNGFPATWFKDKNKQAFDKISNKSASGIYSSDQLTVDRYEKYSNERVKFVPIKVINVKEFKEFETYDIEIENMHEFVCEGYLTHNSAELALGDADDEDYTTMKDYNKYPKELSAWRWASNNSVYGIVGKTDYDKLSKNIALNGEPGIVWLDNIQGYGRMKDPKDYRDKRACLVNPCSEISLESYETCNLSELFPSRHDSYEEFQETTKYAYLFAKSITLVPTHWDVTNAVTMKNRRIGLSCTGIQDAFVKHGRRKMLNWLDQDYEYVKQLDEIYSDWLCIPRSIKMTTVKPSGTLSLLPGVSPGIHYPHSKHYIRRIRIANGHPLLVPLETAGYHIENSAYGSTEEERAKTKVVSFPIREKYFSRRKDDVTIWEQFKNCADLQTFWADNSVSITVTFKQNEAQDISRALEAFEDQLKAVSLLPISEHGYAQAPYEEITEEQYESMTKDLSPLNFNQTESFKPKGEIFCTTDKCEFVIKEN